MSKLGPPFGLRLSEGLGPLPERCNDCRTPNACGDGYCLEAYITSRIQQEVDAERERCARACEDEANRWRGEQDISDFRLCAARIRSGA